MRQDWMTKLNQSGVTWWLDDKEDPQCFFIDIDQCDGEELVNRSRVLVDMGVDKRHISFHAVRTGPTYIAAIMVLLEI